MIYQEKRDEDKEGRRGGGGEKWEGWSKKVWCDSILSNKGFGCITSRLFYSSPENIKGKHTKMPYSLHNDKTHNHRPQATFLNRLINRRYGAIDDDVTLQKKIDKLLRER